MSETTTELEISLLDRIAHNEFQTSNCASPETFEDTSYIWSWSVLETKEDGGVFSSLVKKRLVHFEAGLVKDDDTLAMTEAGFDLWKSWHSAKN